MPIEVELPGGQIAEFPDGTPQEQIRTALTKHINPELARQRSEEARVRAESTPRQAFMRFSNLVQDPFGITDEARGLGMAISEVTKAPFRRSFWTGEGPGTFERAGQAYTREAERARAEQRVAEQDYGIVPGIVGSLATVAPARAIVAAPSWLARVGQSAKLGAGFGAAAGFGHSEGGIPERAGGTARGALIGGIAGPLISEVAVPTGVGLYRAGRAGAEYTGRALAAARNPQQYALEVTADRMATTGADAAALRAELLPTVSPALRSRGFTDEIMADIISRQLQGETATAVARNYSHLTNPGGGKFTAQTARNYYKEYLRTNPTPMNMIDVAKEIAGEGGSRPMTRLGRAAYGLAGEESEIASRAAQALEGRQATQPGRVAGVVRESVGGGDFEATLKAAQEQLQRESAQAYKKFYREPHLAIDRLDDLMADPLFRRANLQAQRQARVEVIRRNQEAARAGQPVEPVPEVDPANQVFSPQLLDSIQRQLRITGEGFASNPNAARHAQNLRQVFLDRIEEFYPTFRGIRRNYATGTMEQEALQAGAELTTRLGAPSREALRQFENMTPAQQELFRIGFARRLQDMSANIREGAGVANQFQTPAVHDIVERLYVGTPTLKRQGAKLLRDLRREAITTRTRNDILQGSRTAEYAGDMERFTQDARTAADVLSGHFWRFLDNLGKRLTTHLGRRGSEQVLRILTETDPARLLPMLNELARAAQTQQTRQAFLTAARQLRRQNTSALTGPTGLYFGGMGAQTQQRAPVEIRR